MAALLSPLRGAWLGAQGPPPRGAGAIRRLYEALALPGILSDYHFAIMGTCAAIWLQRREFPELLVDFEQLCLLDIRIVACFDNDREAFTAELVRWLQVRNINAAIVLAEVSREVQACQLKLEGTHTADVGDTSSLLGEEPEGTSFTSLLAEPADHNQVPGQIKRRKVDQVEAQPASTVFAASAD